MYRFQQQSLFTAAAKDARDEVFSDRVMRIYRPDFTSFAYK